MQRIAILLLCGLMLAGCVSYTTPADRVVAHDFAGSTAAMFKTIDADPNCPDYVKTYAGGVALFAGNLDQWAKSKGSLDPNDFKPTK